MKTLLLILLLMNSPEDHYIIDTFSLCQYESVVFEVRVKGLEPLDLFCNNCSDTYIIDGVLYFPWTPTQEGGYEFWFTVIDCNGRDDNKFIEVEVLEAEIIDKIVWLAHGWLTEYNWKDFVLEFKEKE